MWERAEDSILLNFICDLHNSLTSFPTRFSLFQKWLCLCCCSWCVYGFMLLPHSAAICGLPLPLKGKYHKWENCSLPFITTETHTQTQLWCENLCWCWKVFFAVPFWVLINVRAGCKIVRWSFKMNQVRSLRWYDCGGLWLLQLISDCEHAISLSFKLSEEFSRRQNS